MTGSWLREVRDDRGGLSDLDQKSQLTRLWAVPFTASGDFYAQEPVDLSSGAAAGIWRRHILESAPEADHPQRPNLAPCRVLALCAIDKEKRSGSLWY
jgi:hypothetical protein